MSKRGKDNEDLPLSARLAVVAGGVALRALASTWRYRVIGGETIERLRSNRVPFIFSLWHGQLLPLLWCHRGEHVAILVSGHRDGEIIARLAKSIGYRLIRGSTSRGGERALLALARELRSGREVAVTPDGPRGPARSYAPGALIAAQRAGSPIVPTVAHASRAWRLSSWDGFLIPKPFARVTVAYGEATHVVAENLREAADEAPSFQRLMEETERLACA
jgi:lysophospholipid acyltransferase (LPLAT)-like uncharacterized protein